MFTITEDTLAQYPYRFPLDRGMLADAIERFNAAGVRAIGMDILFDQPTEASKDKRLADAVSASAVPVVVGWASEAEELTKDQVEFLKTYLPEAVHAPSNLIKHGSDGTVRWIYPGLETDNGYRTAFAPAIAATAGATPVRGEEDLYFRRGADGNAMPFRMFPLHILKSLPPQWYAGKIVLIGADLPNEDRHRTPYAALLGNDAGSLPGVVIHAYAIAQLIDGISLDRKNLALELILAALVSAAGVGIALLGIGVLGKVALSIVAIAIVWAAGFALFAFASVMVPLFAPSLAFITALSLTAATAAHQDRLKKQFAEAMVQRRNESLHKLVENSFDGIIVATSEGEIISSNSSADIIMGWQDNEAVGANIADVIPDIDDHGAHFLELDKHQRLRAASAIQPLEIDCARADGSPFVMELLVYTAPVSFTDRTTGVTAGERISYIFSFRDITVRRQAEQAREEARQAAETANRAKTEFLANMSHELRTPLNAIIGFSEIMRTEALGPLGSEQYLEYTNDINNSGEHLIQIINDILDMSKIEAGELDPIEDVVRFDGVADISMRLVADRAQKGEVELVNNVPDDLPELLADERMLKQILLNLLSNAVKFTPEGGTVTLVAHADDNGFSISVTDTGCGIPADKMQVILEPFGQADMTLGRTYEGTGLGLPLVKAMTELHGGALEIDSTEGAGTTATVLLPAEKILKRKEAKIA
ncbi:MAG: ATP-binding protein [Alphaproteobacteria bacterium]